jgi:hypothetical protein
VQPASPPWNLTDVREVGARLQSSWARAGEIRAATSSGDLPEEPQD